MKKGYGLLGISDNSEIEILEKAVFGNSANFQLLGSEGYAKDGLDRDDYYYGGDIAAKTVKTSWGINLSTFETENHIDTVEYENENGKFVLCVTFVKTDSDNDEKVATIIAEMQSVLGIETVEAETKETNIQDTQKAKTRKICHPVKVYASNDIDAKNAIDAILGEKLPDLRLHHNFCNPSKKVIRLLLCWGAARVEGVFDYLREYNYAGNARRYSIFLNNRRVDIIPQYIAEFSAGVEPSEIGKARKHLKIS